MKILTWVGLVGLAAATGGLVMTNPPTDAYLLYAEQRSQQFLTAEICTQLPENLPAVLAGQCNALVESLRPDLADLLRDRTDRLNLGVASLYRTTLSAPGIPLLPSYRVETLGILGRFFTYRAQRLPAGQ